MLSKSNDHGLSVLSINQHYLELQTLLPNIVLDSNFQVFPYEKNPYGHNKKVDNCLNSPAVHQKLFDKIDDDLNPLLIKGASKM